MKRLRIGDPKIVETIIDKQLESFGVTMQDIIKYPEGKIEGKDWYQFYTFKTKEEYDNWKDWSLNFLATQVSPKRPKKLWSTEFAWVDLMYGLKRDFDYDTNIT
jgi:hypothetical protein